MSQSPSTIAAARQPSPPHTFARRTGRRTLPPTMRTSSLWSKGQRSPWRLATPRSDARATSSDGPPRTRHHSCHLDPRRAHHRRRGNWLAVFAQRLDVQRDRFSDEGFDLVAGTASRHAAGKVGHVRPPRVAFLLDHDDVLSHYSAFPTCRPAARSIPAYPSAPRHLACPLPSPFQVGRDGGTGDESRPACRGASRHAPECG